MKATGSLIGILLLLTQAKEPDREVIHLTEITCGAFVEIMKSESAASPHGYRAITYLNTILL